MSNKQIIFIITNNKLFGREQLVDFFKTLNYILLYDVIFLYNSEISSHGNNRL